MQNTELLIDGIANRNNFLSSETADANIIKMYKKLVAGVCHSICMQFVTLAICTVHIRQAQVCTNIGKNALKEES